VLYQHPAVKEAGVVGARDDYRGESAVAFVVLNEGMSATEREIIDHCSQYLAKYKVPTRVMFREALPMTAVGKVLRRELVKELSEK
jgi:long-chain acyl-CoA synthetase